MHLVGYTLEEYYDARTHERYPVLFANFIPQIFVDYLIKALISEERPNVQNQEDYGDWHLASTDT